MPDVVAHIVMGDQVLAMLGTELLLSVDQDVYRFAQLGPDPFIYYRFCFPFARKGINRRGAVMHSERTGEFLLALAQRCRSPETFSFLAGFLCHYALDSITHPYINKLADGKAHLHMAIEHHLDMRVLKQMGKPLRQLNDLFAPYPQDAEVRDAMKHVYGWDDDRYRSSYSYMKAFYALTRDSHGILNGLLKRLPGRFAALSYRTELCRDMDLSGYDPLEAKAVQEAVGMTQAAYRYWRGELSLDDLRQIFGNRAYT